MLNVTVLHDSRFLSFRSFSSLVYSNTAVVILFSVIECSMFSVHHHVCIDVCVRLYPQARANRFIKKKRKKSNAIRNARALLFRPLSFALV